MRLCATCTYILDFLIVHVLGIPKDAIDPPAVVDDLHILENEDPFCSDYLAYDLCFYYGMFGKLSFPQQVVHGSVQDC